MQRAFAQTVHVCILMLDFVVMSPYPCRRYCTRKFPLPREMSYGARRLQSKWTTQETPEGLLSPFFWKGLASNIMIRPVLHGEPGTQPGNLNPDLGSSLCLNLTILPLYWSPFLSCAVLCYLSLSSIFELSKPLVVAPSKGQNSNGVSIVFLLESV